jgi:hypothetical protein
MGTGDARNENPASLASGRGAQTDAALMTPNSLQDRNEKCKAHQRGELSEIDRNFSALSVSEPPKDLVSI